MAGFKQSGGNIVAYGEDKTKYALIHPNTAAEGLFLVTVAFGSDPADMNDEGIRATVLGSYSMVAAKSIAACFVDGGKL